MERHEMVELFKAQKIHCFVENCPCGCANYFAFGRDESDVVWLAFGNNAKMIKLGFELEVVALMKKASAHLRPILRKVLEVLEVSDPIIIPGGLMVPPKLPGKIREWIQEKETPEPVETPLIPAPKAGTITGMIEAAKAPEPELKNEVDDDYVLSVADEWCQKLCVRLTDSERLQLVLILRGMEMKAAADYIGIGVETVRKKRKQIYAKLYMDGANDIRSAVFGFVLEKLGVTRMDSGVAA